MSADPALASYLGNRVDKLPGQGGVFNPVNLALYCYAGNNPLSYRDPDGLANEPLTEDQINTIKNTIVKNWDNNQFVDENGVRWFDQNIFDNVLNIGEGVNNLGCNLATNINILSQEYTRQNFGKSMSQEQFIDLLLIK